MSEKTKRETPVENPRALMRLASAGLELATSALILGAVGYGVDRWLESSPPYFAIGGVLIGFCLGFYRLIRVASDLEPRDPESGRRR